MVGTDDFHQKLIGKIPEAKDWRLVPVLHRTEVQPEHGLFEFDVLYNRARETIDDLDQAPDAIVGHLDFPVTALVSLLCRHYGLPGASPEAVARCEHKFWMRKLQREVMPETTPKVRALNPFSTEAQQAPPLPYTFWLKPVKAHSSKLGFKIRELFEYERALHACRQAIHFYGEPFNTFLGHLSKDAKIPKEANGNHAIAEELISEERLFTIEGFVHQGETVVYGAIETLRTGQHMSSLSSYHYPAELPDDVIEDARVIVDKVLKRIGFDSDVFNAELFLDPISNTLRLLEINPRISKSHSPLFHMVDGASNHRQAIQAALGERPKLPEGKGKDEMAAKFMVRSHEADGIVRRVPSDTEVNELRKLLPDLMVQVLIKEGARLSDLSDQDSYSYELMDIFLGGNNTEMIRDAYERCRDSLGFLIQPMPRESVR
ncbi:acetyl-CoA carboxylase biotin carboxylase subunit family protein [Roseibium salinum]|uniref:ATP-grasp domain-containing protein n=1 Tax=Roseibium salinum TaxID=1604349 RepID=UPI00361E19B7